MYTSMGIAILALLLYILLCTALKRRAIKHVCSMTSMEKCEQLNSLLRPFGYCYDSRQDIISSINDAWQRRFGYTAFFDKAAPHFNMVFDALPIYFDYQNRTWLIEFWKGQYGINTGGEIGLYYTDELIPEDKRSAELFRAVDDSDMLPMYFELIKGNFTLVSVSKPTWWLTAFCMGLFSQPENLCLNAAITFPNYEMLRCFLTSLLDSGIPEKCVKVSGKQVHILFGSAPVPKHSLWARFFRSLSQFANRILCSLFLFLTRPFTLTMDKLLYLYYLLPFVRRRILSPRKYKRCYSKKRCSK